MSDLELRPVPTVLVSMVGGLMVGMTSVGSGSLMIVLLLFLYPKLSGSQLVGTFLVQAVPLTMAPAFGALLFGHVKFGVTTSLIVGGCQLWLPARSCRRVLRTTTSSRS